MELEDEFLSEILNMRPSAAREDYIGTNQNIFRSSNVPHQQLIPTNLKRADIQKPKLRTTQSYEPCMPSHPVDEEVVFLDTREQEKAPALPHLFVLEKDSFFTSLPPLETVNLLEKTIQGMGVVVFNFDSSKWKFKCSYKGYTGQVTFHIRLYSLNDERIAVEFQRRSGSSVSVHHIFKCCDAIFSGNLEHDSWNKFMRIGNMVPNMNLV
eukprot:CAMPEP_0113952902 /NCGR_PEP_ID=MMETSP1339-20121228/90682_1 /TAXON_ID=94617 /ORGANISM="Fibrocapsa japonica" /LENGTH=209 /DNA_ID=CAMNT_0000961577 /DNA_START=1 /DNA_END=630 /DNA_ORIENTATION=- /assembly_acc=CAM_ASM_000762